MILVDSSVWMDYFRGVASSQTDRLDSLLGQDPLLIGDIILADVLQGFTNERGSNTALRLLGTLQPVDIGGGGIAIQAARNFRYLSAKEITVRKSDRHPHCDALY